MEFFVLPVPKPYNKDDVFGDNTIVAAFWRVISSPSMSTTKRKKANMAIEYITQNGIELPVLKNTTDLVKGNKLVILVKPKAKPEPIQAVIERESGKAPPAKTEAEVRQGWAAAIWAGKSSEPMWAGHAQAGLADAAYATLLSVIADCKENTHQPCQLQHSNI